ncbi:MAG: ABC transporter ATP-binding protein [Armatimonadetes bacterium]|nr:ABC transporter ATP-binding protein [Armatimonadota bacterium]
MGDDLVAIELRDVSFAYPDGSPALEQVSLRVPIGGRLALIGPNGAGKSTLLLHLNGLLRGTGNVTVLGMPAREPYLSAIRRRVGLLFQNPDDQLFMPTVFDEVAYAAINAQYPPDEVRRRVAKALATVGMTDFEGKHPANLSVGQKKRVALASVLVTDAEILALDEPSAGLDPGGREDLMALLSCLDCTLVVATHDLGLAEKVCDSAAAIKAGRVLCTGSVSEIARYPGLFR